MFSRKIFKIAKYSYVISLPKELIKKLKWRKGQKVEITSQRNKIQIKDF